MITEFLIECYLLLYRIFFALGSCLPLKNKIVFVSSFSENPLFVYHALKEEDMGADVVFLCRGKCIQDFRQTGCSVYPVETFNPIAILRSAVQLATARVIVVDNYYSFLAASSFRRSVICLQLWHAAGAFKTFGLQDRSIALRTKRARKRFKAVYRHFDKIAVGSDQMEAVFEKSFGLDGQHFLHTGIPRTDIFFDQSGINQIRDSFKRKYGQKKLVLYAPTFRENSPASAELPLDWEKMERALGNDYLLLLKLHPSVQSKPEVDHRFVHDCSDWKINELLLGIDILITDYSSIPFEYALLGRPMIFFAYDLEDYKRERGLDDHYLEMIPGPLVHNTDELIDTIQKAAIDEEKVTGFSEIWNQYSKGTSSKNVANYIKKLLQPLPASKRKSHSD
ncbi:MAG: CDP-glycerol glycerophosphotransferase family protein [Sporolactobacillus sp.]